MTVTTFAGFETRLLAAEGDIITSGGTFSFSQTQARTGTTSLRCNPASGAQGYVTFGALAVYGHFGLYIATLPSVTRIIAGTTTDGVRLTSSGVLEYVVASSVVSSGGSLGTGTWYWIGIRASTGTTGYLMQVDGTNIGSSGVAGFGTWQQIGCFGTEASAIDIYIDDVVVDGAGFLSPSKVAYALPISDNTVTAVTAGAGGTTNLWDAINNTPPAGVASASETNTTNIRYPASATENYIANLETYTTLGVGAGDTVLAVQSVVRHGEDIATNTKTMQNAGALTNPTVGGATLTFGSDGGAHGAEAGIWVTSLGTLTTSPTVTLGTSPTIRASRISEARVGCIDYMALKVAWTPAAGGGGGGDTFPYVGGGYYP